MSIRQSVFVQDATTGNRITPWWLAILIVVGVFLAFSVGGAAIFLSWPVPDGSALAQVREGVVCLIPIAIVFAWVTLFERRRIATLGFHKPQRGVLTLLLGVAVGMVMISVPILLLWATGVYRTAAPPPDSSSGLSALPLVVLLALTVVIQGSQEEILFRGFLFQSLGARLPGWLAVVLTCLGFTLVHGVATRPIAFTTIFFFALFAIFVVLERQSLWLMCGIHAGWNWALGNVFGLQVSGLALKTNAVFFLEAAPGQPEWLTGGRFGTEGSLIASFMIITATVLVFLAWRRRDKTQPSSPVASSPAPEETSVDTKVTGA